MAGRTATRGVDTGADAVGVADNGSAPTPTRIRRRPGRRRVIVAVGVAVLGAGSFATGILGGGDDPTATTRQVATATAKAERRDLVVTDAYDGQLGYGEAAPVPAGRAGVVTAVTPVGTTVTANQVLFSIDLQPTVLLYGDVPVFRQLDVETAGGADVRQLEQALVDLGYGGGLRVDEDFTSATAGAVTAWEKALGRLDPDGVVALGDVSFAPGAVRVSEITASAGTRVKADAAVVQATSTTRVVTIELSADAANRVQPGLAVGLELADGTKAAGKVVAIATASTAAPTAAAPATGGGGSAPTVAVTLSFDDPEVARSFDSGTVEVSIERSRVDGATAVPVTALLALAEGGYAVEVVDRAALGGSRLVPVRVGTYADDFVEVTGEGISPGTEVVVPR